jgi:hypothetical protein
MKIKVVNKSKHHLAQYDSEASAGIYLREYPDVDVLLKPIVRSLFLNVYFWKFLSVIRLRSDKEVSSPGKMKLQFLILMKLLTVILRTRFVM